MGVMDDLIRDSIYHKTPKRAGANYTYFGGNAAANNPK